MLTKKQSKHRGADWCLASFLRENQNADFYFKIKDIEDITFIEKNGSYYGIYCDSMIYNDGIYTQNHKLIDAASLIKLKLKEDK